MRRASEWTRPDPRVSRRGCRRPNTRAPGTTQPAWRQSSFENLNFRKKRRGNSEPRSACPLQVGVEKAVYAVRRNRKLATCVDTKFSQDTEHSSHDTALQQRAVVTEREVERASDRHAQPPVRGDAIIDGLDVALDLNARRVGFIAVVAQEEHERLRQPISDHAAVRSAIDV